MVFRSGSTTPCTAIFLFGPRAPQCRQDTFLHGPGIGTQSGLPFGVHETGEKKRTCDAFCVLINKYMTNDEREQCVKASRKRFMRARRRSSYLERGIHISSRSGGVWHGYGPYDPRMIGKSLDILRFYYNYVQVGKNKETPAMRLGLADGPVKVKRYPILMSFPLWTG